jgi:hypothetical protein
MSRHFFYRLFPMLKSIIKGTKTDPLISIYFSIGLTYGHGAFALASNETEEICITKKYKYNTNGFTNFMIVDDKGRHFNVNNSFWYWKWDSIEDWANIETNTKKITVNYYGYRIPFLGMFPNVVKISSNSTLELELGEKEKRKSDRIDIIKHTHV